MGALELVNLRSLMDRTAGRSEIVVALIDGPVLMANPRQWSSQVHYMDGDLSAICLRAGSAACSHGTFIASVLAAKRETPAPAICPGCTLLVRTIFPEELAKDQTEPSASPKELAAAIVDVVKAGARVLNMSMGLARASPNPEPRLREAMDYAASRGVIPVVAAGNQRTVGSSALTGHSWAVPVVACDLAGKPSFESNLSASAGRRGLRAPGQDIMGLGTDGNLKFSGGTSVAAPFVTGAIALLWSEFPKASARDVRLALRPVLTPRRASLVPALLDARAAYDSLAASRRN
jgi:subtilisin family serine protease